MTPRVKFVGIIGLVLIFFGQVVWFTTAYDPYYFFPIHMIAGAMCLLLFLFGGGVHSLRSAAARSRSGVGLIGYTAIFVVMLTSINVLLVKHEIFRYDSTAEKIYTLAPETSSVLAEITEPITIRAFFLGGRIEDRKIADLLTRIRAASDKIRVEMIDPERKLSALEKYGITKAGTLHISVDGSPREVKISREINEQEIVNALKKLIRSQTRVLYYLVGHGEPDIEGKSEVGYLFFKEAIEGENMELRPLPLGQGEIPADAAAIILSAPKKQLLPAEFQKISDYLGRGGRALLFHEPRSGDEVRLLARILGIEVGRDVVVDQIKALYAGGGMGVQPMVTEYAQHPITRDFKQGTIFSTVGSVRKAAGSDDSVVEIAKTSAEGWAEHDLERLFSDNPQAALDPGDERGPIPVAAASQKGEGRVVVFGDADFITNANIRQVFNRDFVLNAVNWVVGAEQGVTIRARTFRGSTKGITSEQFHSIFVLSAILLPEMILLSGLIVWWRRRS